MAEQHAIIGPVRLKDYPAAFEHAKATLAALKEQRVIPADKLPLDGSEFALLIARPPTPGVTLTNTPRGGEPIEQTIARVRYIDPVAFLVFYEAQADMLWVDLIHVDPAFRRQRMALQLLQQLVHDAAMLGIGKIMLGTLPDNEPMRKLGQCAGMFTHHIVLARPVASLGAGIA